MKTDDRDSDFDLSEFFHRNTELIEETSLQFVQQMVVENPSGRPMDCAAAETVALTPGKINATLADCLRRRGSDRRFAQSDVEFRVFSSLLVHALAPGELKASGFRQRPYPSAGALYPVSVYVLARRVARLAPGIYHVNADRNLLEKLHSFTTVQELDGQLKRAVIAEPQDPEPAFYLLLSGDMQTIRRKYGDRGYRFMLLEAGHIAQNLGLLATALKLVHLPLGGFCEPEIEQLLGVRKAGLMSLYLLAFGNS